MARAHRRAPACHVCEEQVIWAITEHGARQPLDPAPTPDGNVLAYQDHLGAWRARSVASAGDSPRHPLEKTYMPHFATCRGGLQLPVPDNVTPLRPRQHTGRRHP